MCLTTHGFLYRLYYSMNNRNARQNLGNKARKKMEKLYFCSPKPVVFIFILPERLNKYVDV